MLVKGGHDEGDALADALIEEDNLTSWQGQRIDTTSTHGTGCTLASAIAARLALGDEMPAAVGFAKDYVTGAIAAAEIISHFGARPEADLKALVAL